MLIGKEVIINNDKLIPVVHLAIGGTKLSTTLIVKKVLWSKYYSMQIKNTSRNHKQLRHIKFLKEYC